MKLFMERLYVKFQFYISRKVEVVGFLTLKENI